MIRLLTKLSREALYSYMAICAGCAMAMLINLSAHGVGVSALATSGSPEQKLFLLTAAVVAVCAGGIAGFALAIHKKRN